MKPYHQRPTWRWLPGMLAEDSDGARWRVYAIARHTGYPLAVREGDERVRPECGALVHDAVPVLEDGATQGAALAVLREVTGERSIHALARHSRKDIVARALSPAVVWGIVGLPTRDPITGQDMILSPHGTGPNLAAALAAALDKLIPE